MLQFVASFFTRINARCLIVFLISQVNISLALAGLPLSESRKLTHAVFIENKGQWPSNVLYATDIPGGQLFFEREGLTYSFHGQSHSDAHASHLSQTNIRTKPVQLEPTSLKVKFNNTNRSSLVESGEAITKFNYYIGNDPDRWGEGCRVFSTITYQNLYDGVDLHFYTSEKGLKYDLILSEGADPRQIRFSYEGQKNMHLEDECLFLNIGQGTITENKPVAYQNEQLVHARYKLDKNVMSFEFPNGYDSSQPLVIDPELIFSTFSGSISDNFGYTACFDDSGNLYSGGVIFGSIYPGAVGSGFAGGQTDILLLKYDSTGQNLLYGTFLGGLSEEAPHSLVFNNNNELVIMGTTGSPNFPTSLNAYQRDFGGGDSVAVNGSFSGNDMVFGTDIYVAKLDPNGRLSASTFVGGSNNDGLLNMRRIGDYKTPLIQNYGDYQRGDIIMDAADNVYISSFTNGNDFPIQGGFQSQYGGGNNDAVVFTLNSNLSSLRWSSYLGGTGDDAAYSVKLDESNNVLLGGGTTSSNFPTTPGSLNTTYRGSIDGFITKISASGNSILQSTYLGTSSYDQAYFIDIDDSQNVYAFGQTRGAYPITPGTFNVPNSGQFVHKLTPNLDGTVFSLVFGSGTPEPNISPTAFLANECENIFLSGWGGIVNNGNSPNQGNTFGMPITNDALYSQTDGSDFYLMALSADGSELLYSTYFGSTDTFNGDHVDGGTSRFDKRGIMYQSVCSCGGRDDSFPTTPSAYSQVNNGTIFTPDGTIDRCNNAAFKFDLASLEARLESNISSGCAPLTVTLINNSIGGEVVFWDFGDGGQALNIDTVTYTYAEPGNYQVQLTVIDENTCIGTSTISKPITALDANIEVSEPVRICPNTSTTLSASGGSAYSWSPAESLDDPFSAMPIASPETTTTYTVIIQSNAGCEAQASVTVTVGPDPDFEQSITISPSDTVCVGDQYQLYATEGSSYSWSPPELLDNPNIANPVATLEETTVFSLEIGSEQGCAIDTTVTITALPIVNKDITVGIIDSCTTPRQYQFVNNTDSELPFTWDFGDGNQSSERNPIHVYQEEGTYLVNLLMDERCITDQTLEIVHEDFIPDTDIEVSDSVRICPDTSTLLFASGGVSYSWSPAESLDDAFSPTPVASPETTTTYTVVIQAASGCAYEKTVTVTVEPDLEFELGVAINPPASVCEGDQIQLSASGGSNYLWSPAELLDNPTISNPIATVNETTIFTVEIGSDQGCVKDTSVTITAIPLVTQRIEATAIESCTSETQYQFSKNTESPLPFIWDFGDGNQSTESNPLHVYQESGLYTVSLLSDEQCVTEQSLQIDHKNLFIPNAFSPNGDGINDVFEIISDQTYPLQIVDRSGQLIFESDNYDNTWDGDDLPAGVYFYRLVLPEEECNGWIQLLR